MRVVTAVRFANKRKKLLEVEFAEGPALQIDIEVLARRPLKAGDGLEEKEIAFLEAEHAFLVERRRIVAFCLRKPRTVREVKARLSEHKVSPAIADRVFEDVVSQGLLEDREVARRGVRAARRGSVGPLRLRSELRARGVGEECVEEHLAPLEDSEWQRQQVENLIRRRLPRYSGLGPRDTKRRIGDQLLRRGFEPGIVYDVLAEMVRDADEEAD